MLLLLLVLLLLLLLLVLLHEQAAIAWQRRSSAKHGGTPLWCHLSSNMRACARHNKLIVSWVRSLAC
jgi:hypothetical protein